MAFALFAKVGIVEAIVLASSGLSTPEAKARATAAVQQAGVAAR